jgi:ubiquinone/menaquinone biosynthesis C-methylase UbiE
VRTPRADYDSISRYYDSVRGFGQEYYEGWLECIIRHGDLHGRRRMLDVGCGTGRYASLLSRRLGRAVIGLDLSAGMLERARDRVRDEGTDVALVQGDAVQLPFKESSFDSVSLVLVVHHVRPLEDLMEEIARVLSPGGRAIFMTRDHDEIEDSYIAMFPGVLEIDLARFPPVRELEAMLTGAGFTSVGHAREENPRVTMTEEQVLAKADRKFISTLSLMSEEEFKAGREVFQERLHQRFKGGPIPTASFTFVWGEKP